MTLQELAEKTGVSMSTVHRILKKDMKLSKLSAKFIPHLLTDAQKNRHVSDCRQNLDLLNQDKDILEKVICTDECWFPLFDPETKQASSEWRRHGSRHPKKAVRCKSQQKTMCVLFFDTVGVVHIEFLPKGETVTAEYYISVLTRLKESIRRKRPVLWKGGFNGTTDRDFILQQDNATPHVAIPTLAFFGENNFDLLRHPPLFARFGSMRLLGLSTCQISDERQALQNSQGRSTRSEVYSQENAQGVILRCHLRHANKMEQVHTGCRGLL